MGSEMISAVASMEVKRVMEARWQDEDPWDEGPSLLARAAGEIGRRFAAIALKARAAFERREAAVDPAAIGE